MPERSSPPATTSSPVDEQPTAAVVLVNMPFAGFRQPSLALGLLKASLAPLGVATKVVDATLAFAGMVSPAVYDTIATWRAEDLLGDRVFADHLSPPPRRAWADYEAAVLEGGDPEHRVPYFGKPPLDTELRTEMAVARQSADRLLDECLAEIVAAAPTVVGFTSMVHQQVASLALAERVRSALPEVCIVFGGASCRGEMGDELLHSFPFVDAVAPGDGEDVFPELVRRRLAGEALSETPGLLVRSGVGRGRGPGSAVTGPVLSAAGPETAPPAPGAGPSHTHPRAEPASTSSLDTVPAPDFTDYFARLACSPLRDDFVARVPFESSRGCWWGQKRRCTFCGQASASMAYRTKSSDRAVAELRELVRAHPGHPVVFTDEILPRDYFDGFLPQVRASLPDLEVVYFEVRPDMSREQLELLAECGVRRLEAGLESLSTPVLRLMHKGTSALQNVQFLKWARELAIEVVWNILWGFPGEDPDDYRAMAELVPLISHLHPPNTVGRFRLDRFSPMHQAPGDFGLANVRPYPAMSHVYDLPADALARLTYSFAFDYVREQPVEIYTAALAERIAAWKTGWPHSVLAFADDGEKLVFYDHRPGFEADELTVVDGVHRALYLACDAVHSVTDLAGRMSSALGAEVAASDVEEVLQDLVGERLMIADGDKYLSLALRMPERPASPPSPEAPPTADAPAAEDLS